MVRCWMLVAVAVFAFYALVTLVCISTQEDWCTTLAETLRNGKHVWTNGSNTSDDITFFNDSLVRPETTEGSAQPVSRYP